VPQSQWWDFGLIKTRRGDWAKWFTHGDVKRAATIFYWLSGGSRLEVLSRAIQPVETVTILCSKYSQNS
jgi:hypothetical protein